MLRVRGTFSSFFVMLLGGHHAKRKLPFAIAKSQKSPFLTAITRSAFAEFLCDKTLKIFSFF